MKPLWEQVQEAALDPKRICWVSVQGDRIIGLDVKMVCGRVASWWYARQYPLSHKSITCLRCKELGHPNPVNPP